MKILVVEDEQKVASYIKRGLEKMSHEVDVAYDGSLGERLALSRDYDIVLLDVVLPLLNGIDLCKRIKSAKPNLPLLMLTALGTTSDKVVGFEAGADDYLVKPFDFDELIVRIKALTKRMDQARFHKSRTLLKVDSLELDLDNKFAYREGQQITLTAKEFELLEYFMRNKGRVISKLELAERIWDITFDTGTNVVEVYINLLRRKIDKNFSPKLIHTRVGFGYILTSNT